MQSNNKQVERKVHRFSVVVVSEYPFAVPDILFVSLSEMLRLLYHVVILVRYSATCWETLSGMIVKIARVLTTNELQFWVEIPMPMVLVPIPRFCVQYSAIIGPMRFPGGDRKCGMEAQLLLSDGLPYTWCSETHATDCTISNTRDTRFKNF